MYDEVLVTVFPRTCPVCGLDPTNMTAEEIDELINGNSSWSGTIKYACGSDYFVFGLPDPQSRKFIYSLNLTDPCESVLYEGTL